MIDNKAGTPYNKEQYTKTYYVRGVDKDGKPHFDIRMELAEI